MAGRPLAPSNRALAMWLPLIGAGRDLARRPLVQLIVRVGSLGIVAATVALLLTGWLANRNDVPIGLDLIGYRQGLERFVAIGTPYEAFQLGGRFTPEHLDFIHPPSFLPLIAPFAILPTPFDWLAWVLVPIAAIVLLLRRLPWWSWPIAAFLAVHDSTVITVLNGNSSLYFSAAFGWSLFVGWPAGLLAIKPSLALLGVPGFVRAPRRFLVLAVVPLVLMAPFVQAWQDFVTVIRNAEGLGPLYSLVQWPVFLLVALPWLTTRGVDRLRALAAARGWSSAHGASVARTASKEGSPSHR